MTALALDRSALATAGHGDDERSRTPSVAKVLHILDSFRGADGPLSINGVARRAGLPKSTTHRLLTHLEQAAFVERTPRGFVLGRCLFELGNNVLMCRPSGLREVAMPHVSRLFAAQGRVVHLGVLDGSDVVYLEKIGRLDSVQVPTIVGGRMPATCSSLGKAILAFSDRETIGRALSARLTRRTPYSITYPRRLLAELRKAREEYVAYDREEAQVGLVCVAAPILENGVAIGAVSVSGVATQCNLAAIGTHVRRTAVAISRDLTSLAA